MLVSIYDNTTYGVDSGAVFAIRNAIHCYTLRPGKKLKYYMENLDMFCVSPSREAGKTEKPQG